jgi:hypothetical protein
VACHSERCFWREESASSLEVTRKRIPRSLALASDPGMTAAARRYIGPPGILAS